jgi:hypothetical protein
MKRIRLRGAALPRVLMAVSLIVLVSGCDRGDGPRVDFVVTHTDQLEHQGGVPPDLPPEPAVVQGGAGAVEAHGLIAAPDACDDLDAQVEPGDSLLTLRVIVRGSRLHPGGCAGPGRFALFQWRATIHPLAPGMHHVRVLYDYRGLRSHSAGEEAGRRDPYPDRVVAEKPIVVD